MRRVILESPYAGDVERNIAYARACVRDSLRRGEAPIASHLLYTQEGILDDNILSERRHGIAAGMAWRSSAEATVVYADLGISDGMANSIAEAKRQGLAVEFRNLPVPWVLPTPAASGNPFRAWARRQSKPAMMGFLGAMLYLAVIGGAIFLASLAGILAPR